MSIDEICTPVAPTQRKFPIVAKYFSLSVLLARQLQRLL
jgi:hypothetical protein